MPRSRAYAIASAGVLAAAGLCVATPVSAMQTDGPAPLQAQSAAMAATETSRTPEEQLRFRRSLGLSTTNEALSMAGASVNTAGAEFGVPLTDDELDELRRRDQVIEDDAAVVRAEVSRLFGSSALGGVYMDNIGGGYLTVAVTGSVEAVQEHLLSKVQHPSSLRVIKVANSLLTLEELALRFRGLAAQAGRTTEVVRLDERANKLLVITSASVDATKRWIFNAFGTGAPIDVAGGRAAATGTKFNNSPPLRGGQAINSSAGYSCTSAFTAKGTGGYYVLTAGHCGRVNSVWDQAGNPVGIADRVDIDGTDVLRIPVKTALTNEVTLFYTPTLATEARYQTITSSQSSGSDVVGQISCITGQNFSDLRCGEIISRSFNTVFATDDGRTVSFSNGRELDVDCNPGDSGGPALRGQQARGIVSAKVTRSGANDTCVYAHIEPALNQIGVSKVHTDGLILGAV